MAKYREGCWSCEYHIEASSSQQLVACMCVASWFATRRFYTTLCVVLAQVRLKHRRSPEWILMKNDVPNIWVSVPHCCVFSHLTCANFTCFFHMKVKCGPRGRAQGAEPGSGVQRFWGPLGASEFDPFVSAIRGLGNILPGPP